MKKVKANNFIKYCISCTFYKMLLEKDYNDITISEICLKSGYGRTTYYRHFSSNKEELLLFLAKYAFEEKMSENYEAFKKDEGLFFLEHCYQNKEFFLMLKKQKLEHLLFKIFFSIFGLKEDENPLLEYGKSFFVGAYLGICYTWLKNECIETPKEIIDKFKSAISIAIEANK